MNTENPSQPNTVEPKDSIICRSWSDNFAFACLFAFIWLGLAMVWLFLSTLILDLGIDELKTTRDLFLAWGTIALFIPALFLVWWKTMPGKELRFYNDRLEHKRLGRPLDVFYYNKIEKIYTRRSSQNPLPIFTLVEDKRQLSLAPWPENKVRKWITEDIQPNLLQRLSKRLNDGEILCFKKTPKTSFLEFGGGSLLLLLGFGGISFLVWGLLRRGDIPTDGTRGTYIIVVFSIFFVMSGFLLLISFSKSGILVSSEGISRIRKVPRWFRWQEIQQPKIWTDGTISIKTNRGKFLRTLVCSGKGANAILLPDLLAICLENKR